MSTVVEIEKALAALPAGQRRKLVAKLTGSARKLPARRATIDPVEEIIGAFTGPRAATGRRAEDILYGRAAVK